MQHLEQDDPAVWRAFLEVDCCCQNTEIPGTAIGRDHDGEQENKKIKKRGDISGLARLGNSRHSEFGFLSKFCTRKSRSEK